MNDTFPFDKQALRKVLTEQLTDNILPYWGIHSPDPEFGGFYGAVYNDGTIDNEVPRSAILCGRILWTFSIAFRKFGREEDLAVAKRAYHYLLNTFWDKDFGGVYWTVDKHGRPVMDRKHHYAQAFAIYGLSEYYAATKDETALEYCKILFEMLERHAFEPVHGGYLEGSSREWGKLDDMRLGESDMNCRKSMNTLLHILEAYSNLIRVWNSPELRAQHKALIRVFIDHVVDPATGHYKLFFNDDWTSLSNHISYGHDIETAWLLWEAAVLSADPELMRITRKLCILTADSTIEKGIEPDGSLMYEGDPDGPIVVRKDWWPQAEGMVGFYYAYQLSGDLKYAKVAGRLWDYIDAKIIDRERGDWIRRLNREGTVVDDSCPKIGPWECPYHHVRSCLEMIGMLSPTE